MPDGGYFIALDGVVIVVKYKGKPFGGGINPPNRRVKVADYIFLIRNMATKPSKNGKQRGSSVPREPIRSLEQKPRIPLWEALHRVFGEHADPFDGVSDMMPVHRMPFPRVNVAEHDKAVVVTADIPGIDPSKITIEVGEHTLTLHGRMEQESEKQGKKFYRLERSYGEFRRVFPLPAKVKTEEVSAKTKHGVLTITLPKVEVEKKRKVKVENGENS